MLLVAKDKMMQLPSHKKTRPRVLIIEPDENIISFISLGMQYEGYEIESCQQHLESLEVARKVQPDLVILDLDFPDTYGFDLCRQLRIEEITRQCPIIALTQKATDQIRRDAQDAGINALITKPFEYNTILEEIDLFIAHLNPSRSRPQLGFIIKSPNASTDPFKS